MIGSSMFRPPELPTICPVELRRRERRSRRIAATNYITVILCVLGMIVCLSQVKIVDPTTSQIGRDA